MREGALKTQKNQKNWLAQDPPLFVIQMKLSMTESFSKQEKLKTQKLWLRIERYKGQIYFISDFIKGLMRLMTH